MEADMAATVPGNIALPVPAVTFGCLTSRQPAIAHHVGSSSRSGANLV